MLKNLVAPGAFGSTSNRLGFKISLNPVAAIVQALVPTFKIFGLIEVATFYKTLIKV